MFGPKTIFATIVIAVLVCCYFGWKFTARGAYKSAEYTVMKSDGVFEIRQYPDLMLATTNMKFEKQGDDGSFMRLFRYISGSNDAEQKVAMTTPVFMQREAEQTPGQMGFVIPEKVASQDIPQPTGDGVQIQQRDAGRFAVLRFSGRNNSDSFAKAESRLREWMVANELAGSGPPEYAGYDPPWTPGPLRRNEVLIRLK